MPRLSFDSGEKVGAEVDVTEVGPDLYRIEEITTLLFDVEDDSDEALANYPIYRDVIYAAPTSTGSFRLVRVHKRGGYQQSLWYLPKRHANRETFEKLSVIVARYNGKCVLDLGGMFTYACPESEHAALNKALGAFLSEA